MTGTELKLRRIAAHVKAKDLGEVAGWKPWTVTRLESLAHVEPEKAEQYVAALATLTTKSTSATPERAA